MNQHPDISIAIPVYNQERYIEQAIRSTFHNTKTIEVVVLNDGSTDSTQTIIENIDCPSHVSVIVINQEHTGRMGVNMHRLYSRCTGRFISELGSDDFYLPGALDLLVDTLERLPKNIGFVYSGHYRLPVIDGEDSTKMYPTPNLGNKYFEWDNSPKLRLLDNNFIVPPCALRAEIYQHVQYDEEQDLCEDYLFKLELSRVTKFYKLNKYLAVLRVRHDSISNNPSATSSMKPWEDRARKKTREKYGQ